VAIARALLKKTKIMCFDEATSALDTETERLVQEAIDLVSKDSTSLMIAHRLSTIRNCDLIIALKHGVIVE
jgi:ABC-type multidrug transport system fused ATPase/permease subunit